MFCIRQDSRIFRCGVKFLFQSIRKKRHFWGKCSFKSVAQLRYCVFAHPCALLCCPEFRQGHAVLILGNHKVSYWASLFLVADLLALHLSCVLPVNYLNIGLLPCALFPLPLCAMWCLPNNIFLTCDIFMGFLVINIVLSCGTYWHLMLSYSVCVRVWFQYNLH